jgi:hypothetical protein
MTDMPRIGPEGRDDWLTRALREMYAAPADAPFWAALEGRIMARIAEEDAWWAPFAGWVRLGVVAAGVAAAAVGLAIADAREAEARLAYEVVVETPRTLEAQLVLGRARRPDAETAFRDLAGP